MTWYALADKTTGALRSLGTVVVAGSDTVYDVIDLGETRPDLGVVRWDAATRTFVPIPAPVLRDRLDDIESRFQADADFIAVWSTLSAARRTQIRTGIMRVLGGVLRSRRFRLDEEAVEVD